VEKPSPPATATAAAAPPTSDAGKAASSDRDRPRDDSPAPALEPKPEAAAGTQKPAEAKSEGVEAVPQKTAEPKPEAISTPAESASEKPVQPSETPAQQAPIQLAPSSISSVEREPEKQPQASDVPAEKPSPVGAPAADLPSASAPKPQAAQPAVSEQQAQAVSTAVATAQETPKPDTSDREAGARPVRLCPQCHRLVGEDDKVCERCKARLDQPAASEPTPVSDQHLGVPSFAGYATETPASKGVDKSSGKPAVSDPSGIDDLANLRIGRRRRLPVVEVVVSVILLGGAAMAVWMLRSTLPDKTSTPAAAVEVTISPARAKVAAGHGIDFAATVTGTDNYNVDWSVEEGDNGGRIVQRGAKAKTGAVSSLAVYMSPKTPGTYHLTATSKADPGKSASATITVTGK